MLLKEQGASHLAAVGHVEGRQLWNACEVLHALVGDVLAAGQHHAPQAAHRRQAGQLLVRDPPACADVQVLQGREPADMTDAEREVSWTI